MRTNFLTGLAVVLPVLLTFYVVWTFAGFVDDRILPLVPDAFNPLMHYEVEIRGIGILVFVIFTTIIGAIAKGYVGRQIVGLGEAVVSRTPVVRWIYNSVKQIVETILNQQNTTFEQACLVEYPRRGIWAVAFISTETRGEVADKAADDDMLSVFLPTTPNPTSGFLLFVPKKDVVVLDMELEDAAKLVISAGLVVPPTKGEVLSYPKKEAPGKDPAAPDVLGHRLPEAKA
ncbi:MAG: DUF502 domain-containing protein [Paracoccaceae bacterium]|nr:DUF502 domain-containing protein [Paracoccaceae bacterium]